MVSEIITENLILLYPTPKKEKERKEKMMTTALPQPRQRMKTCVDQLSGTVGTNETPPKRKTQASRRLVLGDLRHA